MIKRITTETIKEFDVNGALIREIVTTTEENDDNNIPSYPYPLWDPWTYRPLEPTRTTTSAPPCSTSSDSQIEKSSLAFSALKDILGKENV